MAAGPRRLKKMSSSEREDPKSATHQDHFLTWRSTKTGPGLGQIATTEAGFSLPSSYPLFLPRQ